MNSCSETDHLPLAKGDCWSASKRMSLVDVLSLYCTMAWREVDGWIGGENRIGVVGKPLSDQRDEGIEFGSSRFGRGLVPSNVE